MTIRPLQPQSDARIDWEQRMHRDLAALLDCSNGEARDIAEAQADTIDHCWARRQTPEECAAEVDRASTPADPGPATNPNGDLTVAQEAIAQADAALSNAILPTYSELLAALHSIAEEAGPLFGNDDGPGTINRMARHARPLLARHDKTMAGDFR